MLHTLHALLDKGLNRIQALQVFSYPMFFSVRTNVLLSASCSRIVVPSISLFNLTVISFFLFAYHAIYTC